MTYNKIDFINDLLSSKKIKIEEKNRILELTKSELLNFDTENSEIKRRIDNIEDKIKYFVMEPTVEPPITPNEKTLNLVSKELIQKESKKNKTLNKPLPKYNNPFALNGLSKFLEAYNQHPILKYTCHTIDSDNVFSDIKLKCDNEVYDIKNHQKLIIESFTKLKADYFINHEIVNLIFSYLTGANYAGQPTKWTGIETNWCSEELVNWSQKNIDLAPHPGGKYIKAMKNKGFKLSKSIRSDFSTSKIVYFSDLVLNFKNLFHIKADNSLRNIIQFINNKHYQKKIDFEFVPDHFFESVQLFTNVSKLIETYQTIIDNIIAMSGRNVLVPKISLYFEENLDKTVDFIIHDMNIGHYRTSLNDTTNRIGETHTSLIKSNINGLCELYIRAKFECGQSYEVNLWNDKEKKSIQIDNIEGVQYVLKFRK
jgi:hypothetical protein